jgi:hypothetical protein
LLRSREYLLESQEVLHIPGKEDRVVNHHEILCPGAIVF